MLLGVGAAITEGRSITVDAHKGSDDISCCTEVGKACKTLDHALVNGLKSNTTISITGGNYSLNSTNLSFDNLHNILVHGAGQELTIVTCGPEVGLSFQNSTQVRLANLSLIGAGQLSHSTSVNRTSNESALFRTALYFLDCIDV